MVQLSLALVDFLSCRIRGYRTSHLPVDEKEVQTCSPAITVTRRGSRGKRECQEFAERERSGGVFGLCLRFVRYSTGHVPPPPP